MRHRGQAVLAEAPFDVEQLCGAPDVREFVGDLSARMMRRAAERGFVGGVGELQHHAVLRIRQRREFGKQPLPPVREFRKPDPEGDHVVIDQRDFRLLRDHLIDLLEPHDAGHRVAGILVGAAAFFVNMAVKIAEVVVADHEFAAHRPVERPPVTGRLKLDERQLGRDVLPEFAVAAGRKNPAVVTGGNAVVLRLDQQRFIRSPRVFVRPFQNLFERVRLVERQHRISVAHLAAAGDRRGIDPGEELIPGVESGERPHEFVVARIRNLWLPEFPVAAVMIFDQCNELGQRQLSGIEIPRIHHERFLFFKKS